MLTISANPNFAPTKLFGRKNESRRLSGKCKTATELSSKGLRKRGDFYPADKLIREIVRRQIPLVVSDDAHRTGELGFEFAKSEEYLRELDCRRRWQF